MRVCACVCVCGWVGEAVPTFISFYENNSVIFKMCTRSAANPYGQSPTAGVTYAPAGPPEPPGGGPAPNQRCGHRSPKWEGINRVM